jgi:soluble lytic murein transglycosylase
MLRRLNLMRVTVMAAVAGLAIAGACGRAQEVAAPAAAQILPEPELSRLREGLNAAQFGDWAGLRTARAQASDPLVRKMLTWRLAAAQNSDALFDEINAALTELAGWPGRETMRRRGEQMIFDSAMTPDQRVAWLTKDNGPLTGDGQVALAQAYARLGRSAEAAATAREAWRERALTPRAQTIVLSEFSHALTRADHADRVDRLLWRDDRSAAEHLLSRLGPADRALAAARIGLQERLPMHAKHVKRRKGRKRAPVQRSLAPLLAAIPASRRDDPGLLYDRARYLRRGDNADEALPLIARVAPLEAAPSVREALIEERRLYVPRALREGQYTTAYRLVSEHGLSSGETFADSEWLAGWIALRFLKNPAKAAEHFTRLDANVSTPVSKARALYWRAQSAKALGQTAEADADLAQAAAFPFTYYGQLAAKQRDAQAMMTLGEAAPITPDVQAAFNGRELVKALRAAALAGDRQSFELISFYLDDQLQTPAEHEMLSDLARRNFFTRVAVRSAKAGIRRGIVAQDAAFPLIAMPADASRPDRPEPALILAIARQESEFDPQAVSPVGARGLMQLMPYTAKTTAARWGLPYSPDMLSDPGANLSIGAAYLEDLITQFNGSYVLAIAAYNAGPNRAMQWVGDWGDPRSGTVDVVDWVELIPFSETRNYVQRVLENLEVYRYRLAGAPTPISIDLDLKRGGGATVLPAAVAPTAALSSEPPPTP